MANVTFSRPFSRHYTQDGKSKTGTQIVEYKFNLPDAYNKILRPLFTDTLHDYELQPSLGGLVHWHPAVNQPDKLH